MIFDAIDYTLLFDDVLYSLAPGIIIGFINEVLASFFYKGKKAIFIKDVLMSIISSIIIFSFVISFANYRILRWYHFVSCFVGFYFFSFSFSHFIKTASAIFFVTIKVINKNFRIKMKKKAKKQSKKHKLSQKNNENTLKKDDKVLYNE